MTIREFLEKNQVTDVELANGILINLVCNEALYGLDVDMSNIPDGTQLYRTKDFIINETSIICNQIEYSLDTTYLLS